MAQPVLLRPDPTFPRDDKRVEVADFEMLAQDEPNWCWAATSCMMRRFYAREDITQQQIVAHLLGDDRDEKGPLALVGLRYEGEIDAFLEWEQIIEQIDAQRPFLLDHHAHYTVVYGYEQQGEERNLLLWNPLPVGTGATQKLAYDAYRTAISNHGATYYNFRRGELDPLASVQQ